ncbi:MAG TPA: GAF domain-containing sensor histidine kinase [Anaerolineae bacterium]|nr:GAF domain-containing sensor histidine kinase [Anaerolineae bacterium]
MTLTQQLLIISIVPLALLGMLISLWRSKVRRRRLFWRWSFTLVMSAIWASSVLSTFGGNMLPPVILYNWGIAGTYALPLAAMGLLWTTAVYFSTPPKYTRSAIIISGALWVTAVLLDPNIWGASLPPIKLLGESTRQFDLWAAAWIASWLVPTAGAWMQTQQINADLPQSLYRNRVRYWLLVIFLFFAGSLLASIQQPQQPGWNQAGLLVNFLAMLTGTLTLRRRNLPDLKLAFRQLMSRLTGILIIFGLTLAALYFIVQFVSGMPIQTQRVTLIAAAFIFAVFFAWLVQKVNRLTRRIFLPSAARKAAIMADYDNESGNLPDPQALGRLLLRMVQSNLATDDAWLFLADDAPGGKLVLRPLTGLSAAPQETIDFAHDDPIALYLRQKRDTLAQYDINTLDSFAAVPEETRETLRGWQRVLYKPLHAGDSLIGVLALGAKYNGQAYDEKDLELLDALATQTTPLLAQACHAASLRRINDYVFNQNQAIARDKRHLAELVTLYSQFIHLISPELRRPLNALSQEVQRFQDNSEDERQKTFAAQLDQQIGRARAPIDNLITVSTRIQMREDFAFEPVRLDSAAQKAIRNLRTMADARRVKVVLNVDTPMTTVLGDEEQLTEAVQYLLHNAIKFNKIGGEVQMDIAAIGNQLCLRVQDTGVGIPPDRLDGVWTGLSGIRANGNGRSPGLGLPLARFIVKSHGGDVEAVSAYGSGSTFSIFLPLILEET